LSATHPVYAALIMQMAHQIGAETIRCRMINLSEKMHRAKKPEAGAA
ncbi:MAG: hypothetical protein K0S79_2867, partial [Nitrospira sp.]|nr:hypothetical protein [Nitrospira sp.]